MKFQLIWNLSSILLRSNGKLQIWLINRVEMHFLVESILNKEYKEFASFYLGSTFDIKYTYITIIKFRYAESKSIVHQIFERKQERI